MAFDMQENNKVGFDMSKVKIGDKLVRRDGTVVVLNYVRGDSSFTNYPYVFSDHSTVTRNGYYRSSHPKDESDYDIVGFADEQKVSATKDQQANCTFTEMQAVEMLLSLGYTLKKGV